jgi:hypothetical protein
MSKLRPEGLEGLLLALGLTGESFRNSLNLGAVATVSILKVCNIAHLEGRDGTIL